MAILWRFQAKTEDRPRRLIEASVETLVYTDISSKLNVLSFEAIYSLPIEMMSLLYSTLPLLPTSKSAISILLVHRQW